MLLESLFLSFFYNKKLCLFCLVLSAKKKTTQLTHFVKNALFFTKNCLSSLKIRQKKQKERRNDGDDDCVDEDDDDDENGFDHHHHHEYYDDASSSYYYHEEQAFKNHFE